MEYKDYYKTLGVDRNATEKEIKQAYRRLARKFHPDVNPGDKSAEARFKEINEAYEVLSDKEKRARYDEFGAYWKEGMPGGGFRTPPGGARFFHFDLGDLGRRGEKGYPDGFSEFFHMFFGGGSPPGTGTWQEAGPEASFFRAAGFPGESADQEFSLELSLEEVAFGTTRLLQLERETPCERCSGRGGSRKDVCPECGGRGTKRLPRKIEVRVPPGAREGSKIRVAGEGGQQRGGRPGDLYLVVKLHPHPVFEPKDGDLHCEVPITITEAILGSQIEVPTLKGKATMTIPPETQSGSTFRLAGLGLPVARGGKPGDLYVKVRVWIPQHISSREKKIFEELASLRKDNPRLYLFAGR